MADCIDAQIYAKIKSKLEALTVANGYSVTVKKVEFLRTVINIDSDDYPYILIIPNEPDPSIDYEFREDKLQLLIWFFDGKNDESPNDPFTYRLRNVPADLLKCVRTDPYLDGLVQNVRVTSYNFGVFVDETIIESGVYMFVEIDRMVDAFDPYQLAG